MSLAIKHKPDYYAGAGYLVEVVGCGRDMTLKFRVTKNDALAVWNKMQPCMVFIFNSAKMEWALVKLRNFRKVFKYSMERSGIQEFSSDGNEYVPIDFDELIEASYKHGTIEG